MPDRTVALNFNGVSFRHRILESVPASGCKSVEINNDDTISLLTHVGNHAFRYRIDGKPEFFKMDGGTWQWAGERTGRKYGP